MQSHMTYRWRLKDLWTVFQNVGIFFRFFIDILCSMMLSRNFIQYLIETETFSFSLFRHCANHFYHISMTIDVFLISSYVATN